MNAALELAEILKSWRIVPNTGTPRRAMTAAAKARSSELGTDLLRAMELMVEVDRAIGVLDERKVRTDPYLKALPRWIEAIAGGRAYLDQEMNHERETITEADLDLLEALGGHLETVEQAGAPTVRDLREIGAVLAAAEDLVASADDINDAARNSLAELIRTIRRAIAEGAPADVIMGKVAELVGLLQIVTATLPTDSPSRVKWSEYFLNSATTIAVAVAQSMIGPA